VRPGVDARAARPVLHRIADIDWEGLQHAYGGAGEVRAQLAAVVTGDAETRGTAWWNLWGNIHHQGTIYEATLPAVPILVALGDWRDYPDRAQAILMLREIAAAEGVVVWRPGQDGGIAHDRQRGHELFGQLRGALESGTRHLCSRWRSEPIEVRRALMWLLSTVPEVRVHYHALVDETLPAEHRPAWETEVAGYPPTDDEADAIIALEEWVYAG
jgi:hypothetical protein